ncbi:hypothetical protein RhiirA5_402131 [Rhizophagus irregularis]|uniref:AAA-ATPase-like domain-containing protein n=1 Tax=Rhizophagus irregularis TaxID=588596 RepID=A0A2N0P880_9GLOM|nr:hypothetical protein RhiirA5_402131 [Rhizophagus irregularis]
MATTATGDQTKLINTDTFSTIKDNPNIVINGNYTPDVSDFTKFITSEFMIYGKQANLITHPCQFGKSTNLSMLYTFLAPTFTEEEKTQRLSLFKDLRISKFKWFIKSNFGNWPVIHISFKVNNFNNKTYFTRILIPPDRISIENTNRFKFTFFGSEYNVFNKYKGTNSTMHVWDFDALSSANKTISRNKGTEYDDIAASSSGYRRCTNRGLMFSSFGQLRRVDSVGSNAQKTEFQPGECHFVYVNSNYSQEQSTSEDHSSILQMSTRDSKDEVSSISNHPTSKLELFFQTVTNVFLN